jgi:hypothetical protein
MFITDFLPESEGPSSQKTWLKDRQRSFSDNVASSLIVLIALNVFFQQM